LAQIAIDHEVMTQIGWQDLSDAQRNFGKPKKAVSAESVGGGVQSVGASTLPMISKEWNPRFAQAVMEIMGPMGLLSAGSKWAPLEGWAERHYRMRGFETHAHGTIEVLKMVVATRGLGLARGAGS
jgi:alkylation response protein AidB-like acyl-CoA dehydrogenase